MRHTPLLSSALLVLALAACGEDSATGTPPASRDQLVFNEWDSTSSVLVLASADGSGWRRLSPAGDVRDQNPSWSPSGTRIVFERAIDDGEGWQLWTMDASGGDRRQLTHITATGPNGPEAAYNFRPAWSPAGDRIAFLHVSEDNFPVGVDYSLWVVNADGTNARRISAVGENLASWGGVAWSPDGEKIAYAAEQAGTAGSEGIRVRDVDGGTVATIIPLDHALHPAWSPDGSTIAFTRATTTDGGGWRQIWLADADGSDMRRITNIGGHGAEALAWSPDGTRLAFSSAGSLWTMPITGGAATRLAGRFEVNAGAPAWRPVR